MPHRFSKRLRQQRRDEDDGRVLVIEHDPLLTPEVACAAAQEAGHIPPNAVLLIVPRRCRSIEEWQAVVRADGERRRIEEQQAAQMAHEAKP